MSKSEGAQFKGKVLRMDRQLQINLKINILDRIEKMLISFVLSSCVFYPAVLFPKKRVSCRLHSTWFWNK